MEAHIKRHTHDTHIHTHRHGETQSTAFTMIKKDEELQQNEGGGTKIEKKDLTIDRDCASIHL